MVSVIESHDTLIRCALAGGIAFLPETGVRDKTTRRASGTPPPTMEPNKGRQPAGHLTCVRHGTYLRGGTGV
ncbi:hypothetical protein TNCV_493021 [Trichonephila clavipes]|nr:hypothetical protein TNCV_493021 [Trichonephila clavipes]